jgi:hypothetical protein
MGELYGAHRPIEEFSLESTDMRDASASSFRCAKV